MTDPTREDMLMTLAGLERLYSDGWEQGYADDCEVAIYWYTSAWHSGQWSNLYSALSTSPYTPGRFPYGPEPDSTVWGLVAELMLRYLTPAERRAAWEAR